MSVELQELIIHTSRFYCLRRGKVARVSGNAVDVAIKTARCDLSAPSRGQQAEHLRWEIAALKMSRHPNVLELLGTIEHEGRHAVVTPWPDGGDMGEFLLRHSDANRGAIQPQLLQVAEGMEYLHDGTRKASIIVHGNLCIRTVLMKGNGIPVLSDFSLCNMTPDPIQNATRPPREDESGPFGDLTSLAPELVSGLRRTVSTDVYAFGMLVYEAYAGRRPFAEVRPVSAVIRTCAGQRPARGEIRRPDFTDTLWTLTTACWAQEPTVRPKMCEVRRRLEGWRV
ncbi:kinase-like protein [Auricularia subglabra TFB-10046 SS5]|nr:kinase-like protein [Auricularia subglabra TFB-10046 SS5]